MYAETRMIQARSQRWGTKSSLPILESGDVQIATAHCEDKQESRCSWPEQVFFDGRPPKQSAYGAEPQTRESALHHKRRVVLCKRVN